ncbi:mannan-binding lectin serine protease 1-like [Haliotis asinina]|uniref:mannan-binding lectin serine protease 1-like n=1 Tax=Haliotis asinina TaxID=109174 RepID=UPI00353238AF
MTAMSSSWLWLWLLVGVIVVVVSALSEEPQHLRVWRKLLHRQRRAVFKTSRDRRKCHSRNDISLDISSSIVEGYNRTVEQYHDDSECQWRIKVKKQEIILLASLDFLLENSPNCSFDYVQIFDGGLKPEDSIGKFCGRRDVRLITHSNLLYINFRSDESVTAPGFRFEIRKLEKASSTTCNRTVTEAPGIIRSVNYPQRYPNNTICLYEIKAPPNKRVKLDFDDFSLEKEPCEFDYLTVYDGQSSASEVLGSYCGEHAPSYIVSSTNVLLLYFHSDDYVNERGFSLNYTFVDDNAQFKPAKNKSVPPYDEDCSSNITEVGHKLSSPVFNEDFYRQRKRCRTSIRAPANHRVILNIETFDLEESFDCIYDYVNITYQSQKGEETTVRMCGYQRRNSLCFESGNNHLILDFSSDRMYERSGYRATYRFVPDNETGVICNTPSCDSRCNGYCYSKGKGDFLCACPGGKVPDDCSLNVTWTETEKNKTTYERSKVSLDCSVNHPYAVTVWEFNDTLLPDDTMPHVKVNDFTITLDGVRRNDTGRYTCTVLAGEWFRSRTIWLTVKPDDRQCGVSSSKIIDPNINAAGKKVAGENSTNAPDFIPWQVVLWNVSKESVHCGGVLITDRHVLTAAHCVYGGYNLTTIRVSMGTRSCKGKGGERRGIVRFVTHPRFDKTTLKYDFAILELERPVQNLSKSIYPICLPTSKVWSSITTGQKAIVSGCGKDSHGRLPDWLRMADIPLVARPKCKDEQRKNRRTFSDDMFCAGYNSDNIGDACEGDSGGPLAVKVDNHWSLIGLVSFGQDCAKNGSYGFYANVSHALPWIQTFAGSCGKTRFIEENYSAGRIINGYQALPKQFPWSVAVVDKNTNVFCSATIISDSWLLTARHCFDRFSRRQKLGLSLQSGSLKVKSDDSDKIVRSIKKDIPLSSADLTLVKVDPIPFNDAVQAACLPAEADTIEQGTQGVISGWGRTSLDSEAVTSNNLLYIMVSSLNTTHCQNEFRDAFEESSVCFIAKNTTSEAARGDSGSGLIVKHRDTNTLMAVYRGGFPGHKKPSMYTKVKPFVPWIKEKMGWKSV